MKRLIEFLLSFCFLVLGGDVHGGPDRISDYPENFSGKSVRGGFSFLEYSPPRIEHDNSRGEKRAADVIYAEEIEVDDERTPARIRPEGRNSCDHFIYSHDGQLAGRHISIFLPFCEHFTWLYSDRYIAYQVLRI